MNCPDCGQELHPVHPHSDYHRCQLFLHPNKEPCPVTNASSYILVDENIRPLPRDKYPEDLPLSYLDGNTDAD